MSETVEKTSTTTAAIKENVPTLVPSYRQIHSQIKQLVPFAKEFETLRAHERKVDIAYLRTKNEILDVIDYARPLRERLGIFVDSKPLQDGLFALTIQGKVPTSKKKFTTMLSAVKVKLSSAMQACVDEILWVRSRKNFDAVDTDALEFVRETQQDLLATIEVTLKSSPDRFKVSAELSNVIGFNEASRFEIIYCLWQYVKLNNLQDNEEKRLIHCDHLLKNLFLQDPVYFPKIPELINRHLLPPDPVVLTHEIKVNQASALFKYQTWIHVESDLGLMRSIATLPAELLNSIKTIDSEMRELIQNANNSRIKYEFMNSFYKDPVNFLKKWLDTQSRDLEVILAENNEGISALDKQKSDYFQQDWVREAVFHYLAKQTSRDFINLIKTEKNLAKKA